jgi:catechol 2,3-dioxygenase-like lactoylglutathione lyase family enzyme
MIKGVANIWMPVQNIDRAVDFYENILGPPVVKRDGPWAEVDANGLMVGLNGREPEGAQGGGGPVLTFHPEGSLEQAVEDLKQRDVVFPADISEHSWGRVATLVATRKYKTSRIQLQCLAGLRWRP